jgi:hypothetical protein
MSHAFQFRSFKKTSWFAYAISSKTQKLSVQPNILEVPGSFSGVAVPVVMIDVFCGFPWSLHINTGIML